MSKISKHPPNIGNYFIILVDCVVYLKGTLPPNFPLQFIARDFM